MAIKLSMEITGAADLKVRLEKSSQNILTGATKGVLRAVIQLQRYIVLNKLRSGTPLHQRSGNLIRNTNYTEPVNENGIISATVGTSNLAPYGKVHEYGGQITIREQTRVSKKGKEFTVRSHIANYPERSYLRSALQERQSQIVQAIQKAIGEANA